MSLSLPQFIVRRGTTNYVAEADGSTITMRASNPWEATMRFNNSDGSVTGIFAPEDEVYIYINSVSAGNLMMVGYVDEVIDNRQPNREWTQTIHVVDWVSYLASKTIYEREWLRSTTTASTILNGTGGTVAEISGLSASITGLNTSSEYTPRKFNGTYVKDAWYAIAENAGADFTPSYSVSFGPETYTKTINFFGHGARNLTESGTGLIYKVKDVVPVSADTLMVNHVSDYEFTQSARYRYRTVVATTGLVESFPQDIDAATSPKYSFGVHPTTGKIISSFFDPFYPVASTIDTHWSVDATTSTDPIVYEAEEILCGAGSNAFTAPTMKLYVKDTNTETLTIFGPRNNITSSVPTYGNMGLLVTDWQKISFIIKNALTGQTMDSIFLFLNDDGSNYWYRDIYPDIIVSGGSRTSWTLLEYALPANTTDSPSNGWTKVGTPTRIDYGTFGFNNTSGTPTKGWTAGSYVGLSKFFFYRRQRKTSSTGSGTPATEKIIVDSTAKNPTTLQTLATKEQSRVNVVGKRGYFTIPGNVAFKLPGYNIQVDFTSTLGSGRSGTVRISEINHFLDNGRYFTRVDFEDAYQRA